MENVNKQLLDAAKLAVEHGLDSVHIGSGVSVMQTLVAAIAAAEQAQQQQNNRECGCGWSGAVGDCVWLGSVGPLCPNCHETTEEATQPPAVAVAVPDGYALVPIEPTEEMIKEAAMYEWGRGEAEGITYAGLYRAMLAAAMEQPK